MTTVTPRFHCPLPLAEGAEIALPDAAAHHAARVLRLAAGDAVTLFSGDDGEFAARILRIEPRGVHVRIGAAACRRVRQQFCVERVVPMYEACYRAVM